MATRMRKTTLSLRKSILNVFITCHKILPYITKMTIDEKMVRQRAQRQSSQATECPATERQMQPCSKGTSAQCNRVSKALSAQLPKN